FFADLSMYMPTITHRQTRPTPPLITLQRLGDRLMPRSTMAIVIALSASGLASLLTGKWLFERATAEPSRASEPASTTPNDDETYRRPPVGALPAAPVPAPPPVGALPNSHMPAQPPAPSSQPVPAPTLTAVPRSGACHCDRPESILWRGALPRLSPILIEQNLSTTHSGHPHLELELGVVNNSNQDINDLTMNLQFYEEERGPKPKRVAKKSRALYFEGPLRPGHAIKWAVDGRGTSFEVDNPYHETLALDAADAAPAEAFEELLSTANHRPIRLHGAMMLAALGLTQPARKGALALREALREEEAPYLDRLVSATGPIAVCQLAASESGTTRDVQACVQNNGSAPKSDVTLRVRALDRLFDHRNPIAPPPIVISEETSRLPQPLPPGAGTFFSFHLDTSNPDNLTPETFEVLVVDNDD
ncbi:MAG TPA: hypothetical protein VL137_13875, partial [Polyangiaceae bacterium]|nr:hypothetical protein [Polyangiaceae bacterium]